MIKGHTHVIRTTAEKLAEELDSWLERPDDPGAAASTDYTVTHTGGRDWVIVLRHAEHDEPHPHALDKAPKPATNSKEYVDWLAAERSAYWTQCVSARVALKDAGWPEAADDSAPSVDLAAGIRWLAEAAERKWEPTVSLQAFERLGLVCGEYQDQTVVDDHGVKQPSDVAGWVEDRDRTWIMWIDRSGRPHCLWTQRDESGAVVGNAVNLSSQLTWQGNTVYSSTATNGTITGWNYTLLSPNDVRASEQPADLWLLLTTRHTAKWADVRPGDVLDWCGSARAVLRTTPMELPNGVGCAHVQVTGPGGEGYEFIVRGVHETAYVITRLAKQDLEWALKGEFRRLSPDQYRGRD